jgi:uncharacterized delta-60 repeat protein
MKKFYITILALLVIQISVVAQQVVRFNGTGNGIDIVKAMVVDNSGNEYVTGSSFSGASGDDYVTIKYNSSGVRQWLARYNGPGSGNDVPNSIYVDATGNVYVTGSSDQLTGTFINDDAATVKYSPSGTQLWVVRYDGVRQRADAGNAVKTDANGNVIVTGYTTVRNGAYTKKDYLTIKYSTAGAQIWTATYNGPGNQDDAAVGLGLDPSGNIYVTGTSFAGRDPIGEEDYLTIKYNPSGAQQWVARYNGPISEPDRATAIAVDKSGNSYVTGYSRGVGLDIATVKYNGSGSQVWVARHDGPAHSSDIAYAIVLDNSGNVYVTGSDQEIVNNTDYCTLKYSATTGTLQWKAHYAGPKGDNDESFALAVDAVNNVYVTGYINGVSPSWDIATIKYNSAGAQQWIRNYDGPGHGNDNGAAIGVDGSGNVYVAGTSLGSSSNLDFVSIKYSATGARGIPENPIAKIPTKDIIDVFPNPAQNSLNLHLPNGSAFDIMITDANGKEVFRAKNINPLSPINIRAFEKGTYFVKVFNNEKIFTSRFIKQ